MQISRVNWKSLRRWLAAGAVLGCLVVNAVAFRHAWAMTHFAESGTRTAAPEQLGTWGKLRVLLNGVSLPRPVNDRTPAALGLEFEPVRFVSSAGLTLAAWRRPAGSN